MVKRPRRRGYLTQSTLVALEVEGKTGITGAVSSDDLQVAAWPSGQRSAPFLDSPQAADSELFSGFLMPRI